jgi:hypothetical protein
MRPAGGIPHTARALVLDGPCVFLSDSCESGTRVTFEASARTTWISIRSVRPRSPQTRTLAAVCVDFYSGAERISAKLFPSTKRVSKSLSAISSRTELDSKGPSGSRKRTTNFSPLCKQTKCTARSPLAERSYQDPRLGRFFFGRFYNQT